MVSGNGRPSSARSRAPRVRQLACAQNVVDLLRLQCGYGSGADQAAVGDDTGSLYDEAVAQLLDHRQQSGDIGGIARPQERGDRRVPLVQHDAQHHLGELWAEVLGVARLTSVAPL